MKFAKYLLLLAAVLLVSTLSLGQSPVDFVNGVPSPAQGWTLLTDSVASLLTNTNQYQYLYVHNGRWYLSPMTNLVWSWTQGQQLTGDYTYFDGYSLGTLFCGGSGEWPEWGVGCSSGGGYTAKVVPLYGNDPANGEGNICQDIPDAFQVGACGWAAIYVRLSGNLPTITIGTPADGAVYGQGAVVNAAFSCDSQVGISTCDGTVASGTPIDTTMFGTHSFRVTATDNAGSINVRQTTYQVVPDEEQGWMLLTDQAASQLTENNIMKYLYINGAGHWYLSPPTYLAWNWTQGQELTGTYSYFDGTNMGSFYCPGSDEKPQWGIGCSSGGGYTAKVVPLYDNDPFNGAGTVCQDIPDAFGVGACGWASLYVWQVPQQSTAQTTVGSNVQVQSGPATLTFSSITSSGTTTVTQIDPSTAGQVPGGFAISNMIAYEISTTSTFSGPVTVGLFIPGPISEADFNNLRILHNESGNLVDITSNYDYANLTIYGATSSFSPFYIVRRGAHILPLFDQTKAYRGSSTIPVKLQVLNAANTNISAPSLSVQVRGLLRLQDSTEADVNDAGNSNPDNAFRYDSGIGSTGGYIFNLSTKGLTSGKYALSMYVGGDKKYLYNVSVDIR